MAEQFKQLEAMIDSILEEEDAPMSLKDLIAILSQPHRCGDFLGTMH
jgi:hypothetical protein